MPHPLIREVQLGKTIEELCREHFEKYDFQVVDHEHDVPFFVKEIIGLNNPDLRLAVKTTDSYCRIVPLNGVLKAVEDLDYWDSEYRESRDYDADCDCEYLNDIICRLFGVKRKRPKAKITKKDYVRRKCCPYCFSKETIILDEVTFKRQTVMGCKKCGETWGNLFKVVVTGFC